MDINTKLVLNDELRSVRIKNKQLTFTPVILSLATGVSTSLPSDIDYSNKEEETSYPPTSDSLLQEQNISTLCNEKKHRLHVGTQPGYYTKDHIVFQQSQLLHSRIVDVLENFLKHSNANFKYIIKNLFSMSTWGLEPYTCITLTCSNEMANGLAAIIGLALRQDAIGIYSDNSDDSLSHRVFTISSSSNSTFSNRKALRLMKKIIKTYEYLSAQFDASGQSIEFHDFEDKYKEQTLVEELQIIINKYFENNSFEVKESNGKSKLFGKDDYEEAINEAKLVQLSELIKLTRLEDESYKSNGK
jgi:hypothetical protein